MLLRRPVSLPLFIALTASIGCGAPDPTVEGASATQAISGGSRDETHESVFRILTRNAGANGLCSGVLVAPNLMLTAQHCVAEIPEGHVNCGQFPFGDLLPIDDMLFSNDTEPDVFSRWFRTERILVPSEHADLCGNDVAAVLLHENVPPKVAHPTFPNLESPANAGQAYTAVGYGNTDADSGSNYGERRSRSGLEVQCTTGSCSPPTVASEFRGASAVCSGDSGGPALSEDNEVLGLASRGTDPCETPVYAALQPWRDWLREVGRLAADAGRYDPLEWMSPKGTSGAHDAGDSIAESESAGCRVAGAGMAWSGSTMLLGGTVLALVIHQRRASGKFRNRTKWRDG